MNILDFVSKDLGEGNRTIVRAKGNSMYPLIKDEKDQIIIEPITCKPIVGDVVFVASHDGEHLLHRIVKADDDKLILRGDGNPVGHEIVSINQVIGEAIGVIKPRLGIVKKGSFRWQCYTYLWPRNRWIRAILMKLFRCCGIIS